MSDNDAPQWTIEARDGVRVVRLRGKWKLMMLHEERQRIARELAAAVGDGNAVWDLNEVQAIDSAGAHLLWRLWRDHPPQHMDCSPEHRRWFERLEQLELPARPPRPLWWPLVELGKFLAEFARDTGRAFLLIGQLIVDLLYSLRHPRRMPWKEISSSIYHTGATAIPLLGLVSFLVGIVMTIQLAVELQKFGQNLLIVQTLGLAILRELGPVITGLIVVGRTGSTITASIAGMHLTEETKALRVYGNTPSQRLVLPNVIGMAISIPLLVVWADFLGILGGMLTSQISLGVSYELFLERLPVAVPWINFWIGMGKGMLFGLIIATVASHFGLKAKPNTQSLQQETTNSVVTSLALILLLDSIMGALMTNIGLS